MEIYTVGFTQKKAQDFFDALRQAGIKRVVDVRLNNTSQLAAFAKKDDLAFFLKEICDAEYIHLRVLAPTKEIIDNFRETKDWQEYERQFLAVMVERAVEDVVDRDLFAVPTVLLCSEADPDKCHRRLVAEYLRDRWGDIEITHL